MNCSSLTFASNPPRDLQITAYNTGLLMFNCNHVLVLKMGDYFPELSESNLNMKTNLIFE